jgi:ferredoxin
MNIQIYVTTGTGNSLWVAQRFAMELKEGTVQFIPSVTSDFEVKADRVGLIFPVHIWGVPARVVQFVQHLTARPGTYFFAAAVNAGQPAATLLQLRRLLSGRKAVLGMGCSIVMPSNYTPWGGPGPLEKQERLFRKAEEKVRSMAHAVMMGEHRRLESGPLWQNILLSAFYKLSFSKVPAMDKKFRTDEKCKRCGICSRVCQAGNIEIKEGKPLWLHRCEQCFACLQWCPEQSIQSGGKTVRYPRYHHPEITLKEMIEQAKTGTRRPFVPGS